MLQNIYSYIPVYLCVYTYILLDVRLSSAKALLLYHPSSGLNTIC